MRRFVLNFTFQGLIPNISCRYHRFLFITRGYFYTLLFAHLSKTRRRFVNAAAKHVFYSTFGTNMPLFPSSFSTVNVSVSSSVTFVKCLIKSPSGASGLPSVRRAV